MWSRSSSTVSIVKYCAMDRELYHEDCILNKSTHRVYYKLEVRGPISYGVVLMIRRSWVHIGSRHCVIFKKFHWVFGNPLEKQLEGSLLGLSLKEISLAALFSKSWSSLAKVSGMLYNRDFILSRLQKCYKSMHLEILQNLLSNISGF